MRFARRSFVFLTLGLAAWARGAAGAAIGGSSTAADPLAALSPYLDTLIPRDESGSASDLGVDRRLRDKARRNGRYKRLLLLGCRWLDKEARRRGAVDFAGLDAAGREAAVTRAAGARKGRPQRDFFDRTRTDAMREYYANPASWDSLGFDGPPQPEGFTDHAEAPR